MWIAYLIQASISINNLALGIWGWILPGILLSNLKSEKDLTNESKQVLRNKNRSYTDFSGMSAITGAVIFGILGFIPFNADTNFRHSLETASKDSILKAATKWPKDTSRMLYAVQVFSDNNLQTDGSNLARQISLYNKYSFNAWSYLYQSNTLSEEEKKRVKLKLLKLDPNNPEVQSLS
jgi:hypothetical protein